MNHSALDYEEVVVSDKDYKPLPCPNAANHTDGPSDYVAWHEWARNLSKTHLQKKCPDCGLFKLWEPKEQLLLQLQQQLADSAARSDIEVYCDRDADLWHDLETAAPEHRETVAIAVQYLALRGLIEKHPTRDRVVRFK